MALNQMKVDWSGPCVTGPSATVLHFQGDTEAATAAVAAFFVGIKGLLPNVLTIRVPTSGDVIDPATGSPSGIWTSATAPDAVVGSGNNGWIDGVGASVRWLTPLYLGGTRLTGRTFLVPVDKGQYNPGTGNLSDSAQTIIATYAGGLITSDAGITIYSRTHHSSSSVAAAAVSTEVSWLRSRRT
jgi:hypothetical protein